MLAQIQHEPIVQMGQILTATKQVYDRDSSKLVDPLAE